MGTAVLAGLTFFFVYLTTLSRFDIYRLQKRVAYLERFGRHRD